MRRAILAVAAGVVTGLAGAAALTRILKTQLFDIQPTDPPTFAAVAVLLLAVASAAAYFPARKAARVDPMTALRSE
jgi:putative ABC transport system permease protein